MVYETRVPSPADLHPMAPARREGRLDVGDGHVLAWSEAGAADGVPVIFLHGGPGAGCLPVYRRFFDPLRWRIVLLDQRGAGRSIPAASVHGNTTAHLIGDIERLREELGIDRWVVFGGSWGSTLALAYGIAHPDRCLGFVLRGIFLGGDDEIEWFLHGMGRFFPEAYRAFLAPVPEAERDDLLGAYHRRLIDPDPGVHLPAARAWSRYESACSTLRPAPRHVGQNSDEAALAIARIEAHYFANRVFLEPGALLAGAHRIADHPVSIVQGRYDVVCPIRSADRLARALPGAEYVVVPDAGHSAMEPGIRAQLVRATDRMLRQVGT